MYVFNIFLGNQTSWWFSLLWSYNEIYFNLYIFIDKSFSLFSFLLSFFSFSSAGPEKSGVIFHGVWVEVEHEDDVDDENDPTEIWEDSNQSSKIPDFCQVPDVIVVVGHDWVQASWHPFLIEGGIINTVGDTAKSDGFDIHHVWHDVQMPDVDGPPIPGIVEHVSILSLKSINDIASDSCINSFGISKVSTADNGSWNSSHLKFVLIKK